MLRCLAMQTGMMQCESTASCFQHKLAHIVHCANCQSVEQVSTVLGVVIREQREEKAWTEGVAIWVAVMVVSLVGLHSCCQCY